MSGRDFAIQGVTLNGVRHGLQHVTKKSTNDKSKVLYWFGRPHGLEEIELVAEEGWMNNWFWDGRETGLRILKSEKQGVKAIVKNQELDQEYGVSVAVVEKLGQPETLYRVNTRLRIF